MSLFEFEFVVLVSDYIFQSCGRGSHLPGRNDDIYKNPIFTVKKVVYKTAFHSKDLSNFSREIEIVEEFYIIWCSEESVGEKRSSFREIVRIIFRPEWNAVVLGELLILI